MRRVVLSTTLLLMLAASLGACWVALATWVLAVRLVYDRRVLSVARDAAAMGLGGSAAAAVPSRRLRRLASGRASTAASAAARVVFRRRRKSLLRAASGKPLRPSTRIRALTIVARAGAPAAVSLLRRAASSDDTTVVGAAVRLASAFGTPEADELLLDVLVAGHYPRSRTATELEPRAPALRARLADLATDSDPALRYWAVTLLRGSMSAPGSVRAVLGAAGDSDASVRAAAAEALGCANPATARPVLERLLTDDVYFVRSHAARSVGQAGLGGLVPGVLPLLADTNWWVRAAAKDALLALGSDGFTGAIQALEHEDAFARDGALEVILGSEYLPVALAAAERGDARARELLAKIEARRRSLSAAAGAPLPLPAVVELASPRARVAA